MISQKFPVGAEAGGRRDSAAANTSNPRRVYSPKVWTGRGNPAGHGSLRIQLHAAPRLEGARLDPGLLSLGSRPRRPRWPLLLPGPRPAGGGRPRERAAPGEAGACGELFALFG